MRQIVLDTETTGLEASQGHRIIEIGCVELVNRRITENHWHHYLNPQREIDTGAFEVHGISSDFLRDKPLFEDLAADFLAYIKGAELIIHNAPFDVGFLNHELARVEGETREIETVSRVLDTLVMARQKHPGQKNSLDALCRRYEIDNSHRSIHGALLDARILADVYLSMTGGQTALSLDASDSGASGTEVNARPQPILREGPLPLWRGSEESEQAHREYLAFLQEKCEDPAWKI